MSEFEPGRMSSVSTKLTPPIGRDLSTRAVQLARMIDRLGPGTFEIVIVKPPKESALAWKIEITQSVTVQKANLDKP